MPEAAPGGAGLARGAGGAGARQLALRQVPARGAGLQQALGRRVQRGRAAQQLLGQGSHGGLGLHVGRGQGLAQAGLQQRQRAGAPGQGLRAAVRAAADQQLRALGLAGEVELQLARLGAALGDDARHRPAGGVQRLQVRGQPAAVAHGHPGGAARAGVGVECEVQLLGLVQQLLFQQAGQGGAQPRRARADAARQLHAVPGQLGGGQHRHHLDAAPGGGQQVGRGGAVRAQVLAVGGRGPGVAGSRAGRQGEDQQAHGGMADCRVGVRAAVRRLAVWLL